jgi:exosortase/archaeosortase family protein
LPEISDMSAKANKRTKTQTSKKRDGRSGTGILRFVVIYFGLMALFFMLMGFRPLQNYFNVNDLYSNFIAFLTNKVLGLLQIKSSFSGSVVNLPGVSLDILFGCNGLETVMIYSIAVIAFPAAWKKKLVGIVGGFVLLQIINILRIVGLAYAAVNMKPVFEILHIYVAQGIMIAIALGIFFIYIYYARK